MTVVVSGIYRYPVKGLSAQPVPDIALEAGQPFPFDRVFALSRGTGKVDPADPQWAKKGHFVMLMLDESLAEVRTLVDPETMRLTVAGQDDRTLLEADLETPDGRASVEGFFQALVPALPARPRLVRSRSGHFMDKPDNVLSLINLATLRSLEEWWGYSLDPLRFRPNFTIDGAQPWEEFDWIGGQMRLGGAVMRVDRRNGRCAATNVDPQTGRRDRDLPGALRAAFGHKDLGVYLVTERSGRVAVGDAVGPPDGPSRDTPASAPAAPGPARFICRGCYYVYDEAAGAPGAAPGTRMSELPEAWRCPDCGTDAGTFRPFTDAL